MQHPLVRSVITLALTGLSTAAFAQDPAPPPVDAPPPPPPTQPYVAPQSGSPPAYPPGYGPYIAAPAPPEAHAHNGVFVRLLAGGGYNNMSTSSGGTDLTVSGGGGAFSIAVGGALNRHVVLFGEVGDSIAFEPKVEISGFASGSSNGSAGVVGIGPGIAYYSDDNIYGSATVSFTKLTVYDSDGDKVGETDFGIGLSALVGKEWWVSDNWGLGVAGQLWVATMKDKDAFFPGIQPTWKSLSLNILLTASFN